MMVSEWSPEPPRDVDDRMSYPSQAIVVESDESEDDMLGNAPPGYELLAQGPVLGPSSDEEEDSDSEATNGMTVSASVNAGSDLPSASDASVRRASEVEEVDRLYSASTLRPDLTVDCDQVRAAMAGFTLPPSAVPSWAANIPEGQMTALLTQQIHRIQGHSGSS